jgi:hypothetical protein
MPLLRHFARHLDVTERELVIALPLGVAFAIAVAAVCAVVAVVGEMAHP